LPDGAAVTGSPVRMTGEPSLAPTSAPRLGADTDSVLRRLGATDEQMAQLEAGGLIVRR